MFFRQEVLLRQHGGPVLPLRLLQVQARIWIQGIRQVPLIKDSMNNKDDDDGNDDEIEVEDDFLLLLLHWSVPLVKD